MVNDPQKISEALTKLFRTYPAFQTDDPAATMRVYFEAVEPYGVMDIEAAVGAFLRGAAPGHNPAFAPSAPQVGAEVRRMMNVRLDNEARHRKPILPAPAIEHSPESQARVRKMAEDLAARLRTDEAVRDAEKWRPVHERFDPETRTARRDVGFTAGDPDGDAA